MTVVTGCFSSVPDIRVMITITEKTTLKKKMLEACIVKQQNLTNDFKERIKSLLEAGPLGNEEEYDNNVLSQNAQRTEELNSLNQNLQFANEEMNILLQLRSTLDKEFTHVAPGAVVVTTTKTFFVSVSTEQFQVGLESFIGLSDKSPLYVAMKGKQKGENFDCNGTTYKIIDLY